MTVHHTGCERHTKLTSSHPICVMCVLNEVARLEGILEQLKFVLQPKEGQSLPQRANELRDQLVNAETDAEYYKAKYNGTWPEGDDE